MPKAEARSKIQVLKNGKIFHQEIILRYKTHNAFNQFGCFMDVNAIHFHPAARWLFRSIEHVE